MNTSIITGRELRSFFAHGYNQRLRQAGVQQSPDAAIHAIECYSGTLPSVSGHNIMGIRELRDAIYGLGNPALPNALSIVAPHTHWDSDKPVVITKRGERYFIGPYEVGEDEEYVPTSFVFSPEQPLPYEWTDTATIDLLQKELLAILQAIYRLNERCGQQRLPLGVSLNFRFKDLLGTPNMATIENPYDGSIPRYQEASFIEKLGSPKSSTTSNVQVSWHAYSDLRFNLTNKEQEVLHGLRSFLANAGVHYTDALDILEES